MPHQRLSRLTALPGSTAAVPPPQVRIPVIPATQSSAKLPPNPEEACHRFQTKAATPSERSDAWYAQVMVTMPRLSMALVVYASILP
jgi:hypothetical protein